MSIVSLSTICHDEESIDFGKSITPEAKKRKVAPICYIQEMEGGDGQGVPNGDVAGLQHGASSM